MSKEKKRKVGIIGVGHVGSHVASMLITRQICEELVLIDKDKEKEMGQALDLSDTAAYAGSRCKVHTGGYQMLGDADILVISVGGTFFNENRLEELDESLDIIDDIAPKIEASGFHGIVISITNPCDLVAYYLSKKISATVIGSGTILDSGRFRQRIAADLNLDCSSIEAFCMGEHGDSQVPIWSKVRIHTMELFQWLKQNQDLEFVEKEIETSTIFAGSEIANAKGSTEFGIGIGASELIRCILRDTRTVLPCSTLLTGQYGEHDVFASVLCVVGAKGVEEICYVELEPKEEERFHKSCDILKEYINNKIKLRIL